ncbi:MAG: PKD-like domain-containing protein, partial [Mucilaginibacter sp.]|uniref:PKD-like domain-containing protein n=1 Tax=Mucilaginibacter sp. TaxID=1882438 RepID=UPI0031A19CC1
MGRTYRRHSGAYGLITKKIKSKHMKKQVPIYLLLLLFLLAIACKKDVQQAPSISGISADTLTLNIGDKTVLAPTITNTKGNNYTWLVNGKEVASGQINYTFEAKTAGNYDVTFKIENKGGSDQKGYKIFVEKAITITLAEIPAVALSQVVDLQPAISGPARNDYDYQWSIGDSVISKNLNLSFISPASGTFALTFKATAGKQSTAVTRTITVNTATYIANAYSVVEFVPAPCKLYNWSVIGDKALWQYNTEFPLPYTDFLAKASEMRKTNMYASLFVGSW